jgi:glutathione S-transferase
MASNPADPFDGCTLYVSARSPFARRVRLALREHGIRHEEKVVDVFQPTPELFQANPLGRVPAVRLANGQRIVDSYAILGAFYAGRETSWLPRAPGELAEASYWSGLATGVCEKAVERFLESRRPAASQDPEVFQEADQAFERFVTELEARLAGSARSVVGPGMTQADLDLGSALAYWTLRVSDAWHARYPACARYAAGLEARPSMKATAPPPA